MPSPILSCSYSNQIHPQHIHSHLSCELIYIRRGRARFTVEQQAYTACPGTVIVINSLESHSVTIEQEPYERYFLLLSLCELEKRLIPSRLLSLFKNRPRGFRHAFSLPRQAETLDRICSELLMEYTHPDFFSNDYSTALLKQLLILLFRSQPDAFKTLSDPLYARIMECQAYLEEHLSEPVSISRLAASCYVNADYFSRTFHKITGYSPKQYHLLHRLSYSRELLLQSSLPVQEIALKCGFSDASQYIQSFKKHYGKTPLQYRRQS